MKQINNITSGRLYTRKEVCKILGVHRVSVRRYEKQGLVKPVIYIKNSPRYTLDSLIGVASKRQVELPLTPHSHE